MVRAFLISLLAFSCGIVWASEPSSITIKIKGFNYEYQKIEVESRECNIAKFAIIKGLKQKELEKVANDLKDKTIGVLVERCEKTLVIVPMPGASSEEVF